MATKPDPPRIIPGSHANCFSILRQLNLVTKTIPGSHAYCLSILRQLNLVPKTIPGSHAELFLTQPVLQWQLNQGHFPTLQVLMPIFFTYY